MTDHALQPVPLEHLQTKYAMEAGSLLDLDALLGNLVGKVAEQCYVGHVASDELGVEEVKAIQQHVRRMVLAEKAAAAADARRLDLLEERAVDGVITLGLEVDGGVFADFEVVGEAGRSHREKNTVRDAIDCELRGDPGRPVPDGVPVEKAAEPPAPPSPERLLEIARATGLRENMHGVPPPKARDLLARFFQAASHPDAAGMPPEPPKLRGLRDDPSLGASKDWMPVRWFRDERGRRDPSEAYLHVDLLDEEQVRANHGLPTQVVRTRGGLSPNEALAILRRVPCRPSVNEEDAYKALVAHVQRLEGAPA